MGDANLLKKHVGFVVNKIVIGYKNAEKKYYTAYGFIKVEDYPMNVKFTTGGIPCGMFDKLGRMPGSAYRRSQNVYIRQSRAREFI